MVADPSRPSGETAVELAARFERTASSLRTWLAQPGAPAPVGERATSRRPAKVYDPDAVAAYLRATGHLAAAPPEPGAGEELLTLDEAAAYAGIGPSTARAYLARGQWPEPDEFDGEPVESDYHARTAADGTPLFAASTARWRRASIDAARAQRKRIG